MKRVNKSTLAAEALALQESIDHGLYLRALIRDQLQQDSLAIPIQAWIDSANVERALVSTSQVADHMLRVDKANIKETIRQENVKVCWCPGD